MKIIKILQKWSSKLTILRFDNIHCAHHAGSRSPVLPEINIKGGDMIRTEMEVFQTFHIAHAVVVGLK